MKKAGIIIDINGDKTTIMLSQGAIIEQPTKKEWHKGELVIFTSQKPFITFNQFVSIAACLLILTFVGNLGIKIYHTETTVISMDINPSIEFSVNQFDRIINVKAYNKDGETLLKNASVMNASYLNAMKSLLQTDESHQKLLEQELVTFSVYSQNTTKEQRISVKLQTMAKSIVTSMIPNEDIEVETLQVNEDDLTNAHHYGITAAKYYYLQQLQSIDTSINIHECSHQSITEIRNKIQNCNEASLDDDCNDIPNSNLRKHGKRHHNESHE